MEKLISISVPKHNIKVVGLGGLRTLLSIVAEQWALGNEFTLIADEVIFVPEDGQPQPFSYEVVPLLDRYKEEAWR